LKAQLVDFIYEVVTSLELLGSTGKVYLSILLLLLAGLGVTLQQVDGPAAMLYTYD
jgi:hypothetical protein